MARMLLQLTQDRELEALDIGVTEETRKNRAISLGGADRVAAVDIVIRLADVLSIGAGGQSNQGNKDGLHFE